MMNTYIYRIFIGCHMYRLRYAERKVYIVF